MAAKKKNSTGMPNRQLQVVTIRLLGADIARARELAEQRGLGYQVYLRLLLHDALQQIEVRP